MDKLNPPKVRHVQPDAFPERRPPNMLPTMSTVASKFVDTRLRIGDCGGPEDRVVESMMQDS